MPGTWTCTEDEDYGSLGSYAVKVINGTSGAPATFADFVIADRAGESVLLAATACNTNMVLTYQIRPVELLALQISFILAGTSAGAGDTLDITGTDWDDQAQTENIDVSAGDGTYTGAKKWRTITDIDCTGWADGTLRVTQPQWGLIWDFGNSNFKINSNLLVGDGSTSTYLTQTFANIVFETLNTGYCIEPYASSTITFGILQDATDKTTYGGVNIIVYPQVNNQQFIRLNANSCNVYFYSSNVQNMGTSSYYIYFNANSKTGTHRFYNCSFDYRVIVIYWTSSSADFYNVILTRLSYFYSCSPGTIDTVYVWDPGYGFRWSAIVDSYVLNITVKNWLYYAIYVQLNAVSTLYLRSASIDNWASVYFEAASVLPTVARQEKVNIEVVNAVGTLFDNEVTVLCQDVVGNTVFSVATSSGAIAQQWLTVRTWNYPGGAGLSTAVEKGPFKFTISAAGYETLTLENITIDDPVDWHLELQDAIKLSLDGKRYEALPEQRLRSL